MHCSNKRKCTSEEEASYILRFLQWYPLFRAIPFCVASVLKVHSLVVVVQKQTVHLERGLSSTSPTNTEPANIPPIRKFFQLCKTFKELLYKNEIYAVHICKLHVERT